MPFYTQHPGFLQAQLISGWRDESGRFHDVSNSNVQAWVADTANAEATRCGEYPQPSYLAHMCQLPSGNAAAFAYASAGLRCRSHYYHRFSFSDGERDYIPPVNPSEDGEHTPFCGCSDCVCDCGECFCGTCNPNGDVCWDRTCSACHSACDHDCSVCHPDGCDCDWCDDEVVDDDDDDDGARVDSFDDQDDDDFEYAGRPAMPDAVPGRCRFGIEVEFNAGDRAYIADQLIRYGIACTTRDYTHEIVPYWKMTTDASVTGGEIVSPILRGDDQSIEEVREVLRVVKASGGYTARNVGMHVHLDVTTFGRDQLLSLAHNLRASEKMLAGFVPKHRYNGSNDYGARLLGPRSWDSIQNWIGDVDPSAPARTRENRNHSCPVGRYVSMNFNSLLTYGTVECRLLGHTLNTVKVRTWIRTLQSIVEASAQEQNMPECDGLIWLARFGLEAEHAFHFREVVTSRGNEASLVCAA